MSVSPTSSLSAGVQQVLNAGLLPANLNASTLNGASAAQLNQLAKSATALQQVGTLLGFGTASTDSATLSSAANNALLQEINPPATSAASSTTDPLTAAVDNALTYTSNAAVNQFAPASSAATGTQINLLG
jgi:hypothetical protein